MAVIDKKSNMYEEDPLDRNLKEVLDDIDYRTMLRRDNVDYNYVSYELERMFWEEDVNLILSDLGINKTLSIDNVPEDRIKRIFSHYYTKSVDFDDDAVISDVDPLPNYYAGNGSLNDELFKFGYTLGQTGEVGYYYKLLIDINFCRGFWLGKFEKAIKEDNDDLILSVSEDMKMYDPENYEEELNFVVNKCFSYNEEEMKPKKL